MSTENHEIRFGTMAVKKGYITGRQLGKAINIQINEDIAEEKHRLISELLGLGKQHEPTRRIQDVLFHPSFPVDVRHNTKIDRKTLAEWAIKQRLG